MRSSQAASDPSSGPNHDWAGIRRAAADTSGVAIELTGQAQWRSLSVGRFKLENGLTIVLAIDPRAPVFSYQSWFRVGSRDEESEHTGLAHLLEHLMFKGTPKHPDGEMDRELEVRGAQTNAGTWADWTYYVQSLPCRNDNLERVIAYESDRLQNLALNKSVFESELEVVKNERRLTVDDAPDGRLSEELIDLVFTEHPYRRPTIGYASHLERTTLDDIVAFYQNYYCPNNAIVSVAGDIDPTRALSQLASSYAPLKPHNTKRVERCPEPKQTKLRTSSFEAELSAPIVSIAHRVDPEDSPQFSAIELALYVLEHGDSSLLRHRIINEMELATDLGGFAYPFSEPSLVDITAYARPGKDVDTLTKELVQILEGLAASLTHEEFERAKTHAEFDAYEGLRDCTQLAEALGDAETKYHDFARVFSNVERFGSITLEMVKRACSEVFAESNRSIVVARPKS